MIYFIRNGRGIKVGFSENVEKRLRVFRTTIPEIELIATMPGGRGHERALHVMLAEHRMDGEWFRDNEHVRSAIEFAVANGVEELKSVRRTTEPLDETVIKAKRLAEIIMRGRAKTSIDDVKDIYGVPSSVIYNLRYNPDNRLSASSYIDLLRGARRAVADAMRELADDLDFIDDIERADADQENLLLDLQEKVARLLEERDTLASAREILRGEVKS